MKWRQGRGSDRDAPAEAHFEIEFDDADEAGDEAAERTGAAAAGETWPEGGEPAGNGGTGAVVQTAAAVADTGVDSDEVWSRELPGWLKLTWRRAAVLAAVVALVAGTIIGYGQVRAAQQRDRDRYTVVVLSAKYVPGAVFPALNYDVTLLDRGPAAITVLTMEVFAPGVFDAYAWRISGLPVGKPTKVMLQGFYVCVGDEMRGAELVTMSVTGPTGQPDSLTLSSAPTGPGPSPAWLDQRAQMCDDSGTSEHLKVQDSRPMGASGAGGEQHAAP